MNSVLRCSQELTFGISPRLLIHCSASQEKAIISSLRFTMHGSRRPLSPASSGSSRLLLHAPSSSSTPPTSSAFFQHRLRNQPTPSLPNLRSAPVPLASPRPPHHLDHPADRMPDDHSLPPQSPTSPLAALPTSASDLQRHLYASFLEGKTADVSLRINGSWRATYRLHRVVLIQAVSPFIRLTSQNQLYTLSSVHRFMHFRTVVLRS